MRLILLSLLLCLPVTGFAAWPSPQDDDNPDGNKLVNVKVVADHEAIQAGSTFTLAVKFAIEPKWHIYWENPGNTGVATRAKITAPAGFEVGPLRFPTPHRHEQPGDIVGYIHEGELVVLVDVKAPKDAKPGTKAMFEVEGHWLVCTEVCVPGSGKDALELAVADVAKPANQKPFDAWRAKMPKPWGDLQRAMITWTGDESTPKLQVVAPGATALEFFPYKDNATKFDQRAIEVGKQGSTLTATFDFKRKQPEDQPMARGILWVKTKDGEASYVLESAFPKKG